MTVSRSYVVTNVPVTTPAPLPANITVAGGAGCGGAVSVAAMPGQTVLTVGDGGEFKTIGAAVAAAANGDLILVAPGTYVNDFADVTAQVTIAGAGGIVNLVATQSLPNEKGIFIVDNSCTIENLSFQGAAISDADGGNGAGIRYQGGNLVLNNDSFIGNQDGILAAAVDGQAQNTVTITNSTFDNNGQSTGQYAGYTHNVYISNGVTSLIAEHDVFERANQGHELKSRAESNLIAGNIFYDGPAGTASYSIDLPNGGNDSVVGNTIEKGPQVSNEAVIHFGGEGIPYGGSALTVTGNHFINDLGPQAIGVLNQTTLNVNITGNEFDNFAAGGLASGPFSQSGNIDQNGDAIASGSSSTFASGTDVDDFSGDSLAHTLTLNSSIGVRGGGGLLTTFDSAGHVTILGGSGGLYDNEAPGVGGSYIATAAGASDTILGVGQDVVDSEGNDSIVGGDGNLFVQVDGQASITGADYSNAYVVDGSASIQGGGGSDTVQLNSATASAVVTGAEGYFQTTVNGGSISYSLLQGGATEQATITGGGVAAEVYNGASVITTAGGSGATLAFGAGAVNVLSHGQDSIFAGSGPDTIIVSASAQVHAGAGLLSVFGRSESGIATVYGAAGTVSIGGDSGGILYDGGSAANTVLAALANITLHGGSGALDVAGGSDQTVTGGTGGILFTSMGGGDVITTQTGAADSISFAGACQVTSNGNDTISAGSGNSAITANGNASITGSSGAAFYVLNGRDTLSGYGYTRASVGGAGDVRLNAYGALTDVQVQGGRLAFTQLGNKDHESATVVGSAEVSSAASGNLTTITLHTAGSRVTVAGGHENVTAVAGTRVNAGTGADTVNVYGGNVLLNGSTGALTLNFDDASDQAVTTVFGGAGAVTETRGYGNLIFSGGSGSANLGGTFGSETVAAGSGNITLGGGNSGTVFAAFAGHGGGSASVALTAAGGHIMFGTGATTVSEAGWGGAVVYDFAAGSGGGADVISGFRVGTDQLVFQGVSIAQQASSGGATSLVLSDGTRVTLMGVGGVVTGSVIGHGH